MPGPGPGHDELIPCQQIKRRSLKQAPAAARPFLDPRIIVGIMLAMFLSALEQTIVGPALPTIGRLLGRRREPVLGGDRLSAQRNTASRRLFGKLSDIYGRRR